MFITSSKGGNYENPEEVNLVVDVLKEAHRLPYHISVLEKYFDNCISVQSVSFKSLCILCIYQNIALRRGSWPSPGCQRNKYVI